MTKKDGVFRRIYNAPYGYTNVFQLFDSTKNSKDFIQRLRLQVKIPAHNGCVNSICWSETGRYLLSGSDDQHICLTHAYTHSILSYVATGHRANIFSAKFIPSTSDSKVVSCSGDGIIIYSDLDRPDTSMVNKYTCHFGTAYEIMTVPNDPNTFLSCGEDGTVRWFDLRTKTSCSKDDCKEDVLINCHSAVTALAVNPVAPYQLAVGCSDASVRVYDRRMLGTAALGNYTGNGSRAVMANFTVPEFTSNHRITSLCYSRDGHEMLVSYSSDFVYLFDIRNNTDKDPKALGASSCPQKKSARNKSLMNRPLMKRLRVRGDWSDTGPNARPESETRGEHQPRSLHASLMQRMSDVLTSMYNNRTRSQRNDSRSSTSSHSGDSEMEENDAGEADSLEVSPPSPRDRGATLEERDQEPSSSQQPTDSIETSKAEKNSEQEDVSLTQLSAPAEASHTSVDIPYTTITVPSPPPVNVNDISNSESQNNQCESPIEALNLSLQNIKHELSVQNASSGRSENQSVIINEPADQNTVIDLSVTSGDYNKTTPSQPPESSSSDVHNGDDNINIETTCSSTKQKSDSASLDSNCDKMSLEASSSSEGQSDSNCDFTSVVSNAPEEQSNCENNPCPSTSESGVQVPNIYVAAVPAAAAEASSSRERQNSGQGEVSFMMEMDAWEIDSEEERDSPLASYQRAGGNDARDSVMSAFSGDSRTKDEEMESEDQCENYVLTPTVRKKYTGHRNARTMLDSLFNPGTRALMQMLENFRSAYRIKEATFWGDNFVMSGSDCGHIFIWDRHSTDLVMLMEADHHVVNCLQPHPFDPILASSGIDYDIKIWAPLREEPFFDEEKADEIIKRNKVMLEETKDTITVPATFMIRMLASLNHITSGSGWRRVARQLRDGSRNRNTR